MTNNSTKKKKLLDQEKRVKGVILAHLEKYQKYITVDESLVNEVAFMLIQIEEVKDKMREDGPAQKAKTGWYQKSAHMQIYSDFIRNYFTACSKLGLSPYDREKWKKEQEKQKPKGIK